MADTILIHRGGPDTRNTGQQGTYPVLLPSPECRLYPASHNMGRTYSDRLSIDSSNESMMCFLSEQGIEVDTKIYTSIMPAGVWAEFANIRLTHETPGLVFDVELVDMTEVDGTSTGGAGCNIKCSLPSGKVVTGMPDENNVVVLATGIDAGADLDVFINQWAMQYPFPRAAASFNKVNKVMRLKVTAIPADGVFGDACGGKAIGIETSVVYTDPCFIDSVWGDCGSGMCG